jgi:ammonium transporter, Amt family
MNPLTPMPFPETSFALTLGLLLLAPMAIAGVALVNTGLGRSRSAAQSLLGSLVVISTAVIAFALVGAAIAAGTSADHVFHVVGKAWNCAGAGPLFLKGFSFAGPRAQLAFLFELLSVALVALIPWGSGADRLRLPAGAAIAAIMGAVVFPLVAHWVWGGGWLAKRGVIDFAGGIVVHVTAGVSAVVIAWMLKPRADFPRSVRPPHAPWMVMVGASLLWVGWFGFNAGSALAANADAGMAMLTTHLSAATATLMWMAIEWISFGKPSLVGAVTGTIAGLATITPAAGSVGPIGAVLLGGAASLVCYAAVHFVKRVLVVDDALDVLGVHGVGGALGTLALPFLAGLGTGGSPLHHSIGAQFLVQLEGVAAVLVWSAGATFAITKVTGMVLGLRVDREHEIQGLDFATHGESAYHTGR